MLTQVGRNGNNLQRKKIYEWFYNVFKPRKPAAQTECWLPYGMVHAMQQRHCTWHDSIGGLAWQSSCAACDVAHVLPISRTTAGQGSRQVLLAVGCKCCGAAWAIKRKNIKRLLHTEWGKGRAHRNINDTCSVVLTAWDAAGVIYGMWEHRAVRVDTCSTALTMHTEWYEYLVRHREQDACPVQWVYIVLIIHKDVARVWHLSVK